MAAEVRAAGAPDALAVAEDFAAAGNDVALHGLEPGVVAVFPCVHKSGNITEASIPDLPRHAAVAAPLRNSVVDALRNAIAVGRFQPGQRLVERELCDMTGVSRTLVREALRQLESERLITIRPNRGALVTRLTADQARDIYAMRIELEGLAAQFFAEKAIAEHRKALTYALSRLKRVLRTGNPIERLQAKKYN